MSGGYLYRDGVHRPIPKAITDAVNSVSLDIQIEVTGRPSPKYLIIDGVARMNAALYMKETERERNHSTPNWARVLGVSR